MTNLCECPGPLLHEVRPDNVCVSVGARGDTTRSRADPSSFPHRLKSLATCIGCAMHEIQRIDVDGEYHTRLHAPLFVLAEDLIEDCHGIFSRCAFEVGINVT